MIIFLSIFLIHNLVTKLIFIKKILVEIDSIIYITKIIEYDL